ncbi:MAG: TolC family protein, partial [Thiogranum sp.]|nr:TolC family protein [Thiogranum sp.]
MNPLLCLCAAAGVVWCCAAVAEPLPQPLTLDYALSLASAPHPDVETQLAGLDLALARQQQTAAENAVDARVIADGRWVEPSTREDRDETGDVHDSSPNDSRLHLVISKRLYDFGQSDAQLAAAGALRDVQQRRLEALQGKRRLQIMRSYFDVLLADLAFAEADEAMAIEYVRFDRLRERNALKQVSDVEVAQQEFSYQRMRLERYKADARRRTSRAQLAEVLGRPGELPGDLLEPAFAELPETPDPETWMEQALQANPLLLALRAEAEAAREHLRAARYANRPVLSGELSASDYAREFASRDRYRAAVKLDVPLYTGGRV